MDLGQRARRVVGIRFEERPPACLHVLHEGDVALLGQEPQHRHQIVALALREHARLFLDTTGARDKNVDRETHRAAAHAFLLVRGVGTFRAAARTFAARWTHRAPHWSSAVATRSAMAGVAARRPELMWRRIAGETPAARARLRTLHGACAMASRTRVFRGSRIR